MGLNVSGFVLEEMRIATGNNPYCYSPDNLISDQSAFDSAPNRGQYLIWVSGQVGDGIDICDKNLIFNWTENPKSILRFGWDFFSKRWNPLPGANPRLVGKVTNSPRQIVPVPDVDLLSESPYQLFFGNPERVLTLKFEVVDNSSLFTDPQSGFVQISKDKGEVNFSSFDLINEVFTVCGLYICEQSFFDRSKVDGSIGKIDEAAQSQSSFFLNPIPSSSQTPLIKINNNPYLSVSSVQTESQLSDPGSGNAVFSLDTGRITISKNDSVAYQGEQVFYDGVTCGSFSLYNEKAGESYDFWPKSFCVVNDFVGSFDVDSFIFYTDPSSGGKRHLSIQTGSGPIGKKPKRGVVYVNTDNGKAYLSPEDSSFAQGSSVYLVKTFHEIKNGVSVRFHRSAVNDSDVSVVPDLKEVYRVTDQVIVDGLTRSPVIFLPTIPISDPDLSYRVENGNGTYVGSLHSVSDASKLGVCYSISFNTKQFQFFNRKKLSQTIKTTGTSSIKLPDSAIYNRYIEVSRDGVSLVRGSDFSFDQTTGIIDFVDSIGKNAKNSILGLSGHLIDGGKIITGVGSLPITSLKGYKVVIESGDNAGIYTILSNFGSNTIEVDHEFQKLGLANFDIFENIEVLADTFWFDLNPIKNNIQILFEDTTSGLSTVLPQSEYSVIPQTGQVNLNEALTPGQFVRVNYVYTSTNEDTAVSTDINTSELARFKVRRELGSYLPKTSIVNFNPTGKSVSLDSPVVVYVNGVSLDSKNTTILSNNQIRVSFALTNEVVYIDYYINESNGGERLFKLRSYPVNLDFISITSGSNSFVVNGDYSQISLDSLVMVDDKVLLDVLGSSYDAQTNKTTVTLILESAITTDINSKFRYSYPITSEHLIVESGNVEVVPSQSNSVIISGDVTSSYKGNIVIYLDHDPFLVISSSFDKKLNRTNVLFASKTLKNYISPVVKHTRLPVFFSTDSFSTANSLHTGLSKSFYAYNNDGFRLLEENVDFILSEGGSIKLSESLSDNASLYASYSYRVFQPIGSVFAFNYAHMISPNETNGLFGQRLLSSYNLRNPDAFFFRTESIGNLIPEVTAEIKKTTVSPSGPSISNASSMKIWDYGNPGLYFEERKYQNLDLVVCRFLSYYNDQANSYEDILACLDGRVVGGNSGRFLFDGNRSGTERDSYYEVRNFIDDLVALKDVISVDSLSPFSTSVKKAYDSIWKKNKLSRLYPSFSKRTLAFNDQVGILDYGDLLGSINKSNITSCSGFSTTPSRAAFSMVDETLTIFTMVGENGNADANTPRFYTGQKVLIHDCYGTAVSSSSVTAIGSSPFKITISDPLPDFVQSGSISADTSDSSSPGVHYYQIGRHVSVDNNDGQVYNSQLPAPFGPTDRIAGSELLDTQITFLNGDTAPFRAPVFDGLQINDDGEYPNPVNSFVNELSLFENEKICLSKTLQLMPFGIGPTTDVVINSSLPVEVDDFIKIVSGTYAGVVVKVVSVTSSSSFTIDPHIPPALTLQDAYVISYSGDLSNVIRREISLLEQQTELNTNNDKLGTLNNELKSAVNISTRILDQALSGYGNAVSGTLVGSIDFSAYGIDNSYYVLVESGTNIGLYSVDDVSGNVISFKSNAPYKPIPYDQPTYYSIRKLDQFSSSSQVDFLAGFMNETTSFINQTKSWLSTISQPGVPVRLDILGKRTNDIGRFIQSIEGILSDDTIYDGRFLWVDQRVNLKSGFISLAYQAVVNRYEQKQKLVSDQKKLYLASKLS
jgi:hypothetical protein